MTSNIFDPSAIIATLPSLLPTDSKALESPQDGLAALIHTAFTILAFRLTSIDESSTSTSQIPSNVLPDGWNKNGPSHYTFKYKHDQSSLDFLIKVSRLGTRTIFNAIALESEKVATLDISTADFTSQSFYPHTFESSDATPLVHGFISSNRVTDLLSQFKLKIIQKLIPGLQKPGYIEGDSGASSSSAPPPAADPRVPRPHPENPPDAPDRFYPPRPDRGFPRNPLEIGRRDLDPFPLNPFVPLGSVFPGSDGDGMYVGPDHPIFGIGRGRGSNGSPGLGPWGGDGYLPPLGAPPGARFDPVGPQPFPNFPGGRGRMPQNPDNDEFMPPGMGDMFM